MPNLDPSDSRGYFMLPQHPEQSSYYTYGTPGLGAGQYATPELLSLIFMVEHRWQGVDSRRFGIGNISLAGGAIYKPHDSHRSGRDADIRLLRKDGQAVPVTRFDVQYDRDATARLIAMFYDSHIIKVIYFNDLTIPRVRPLSRHDDHFHVTIQSSDQT